MKTINKLMLTAGLLAAGTFAASAQSLQTQNQASQDINASAKVLKVITATTVRPVAFGAVAATTTPYLSPLTTVPNANVPSPSRQLGKMTVNATFDEYVGVTFPVSVTLNHENAPTVSDQIRYVPQVSVAVGDAPDNTGAVLLGDDATYALNSPTVITSATNTVGNGMGGAGTTAAAGFLTTKRNQTPPTNNEIVSLFFGGWLTDATATPARGPSPTIPALPSSLTSGTYEGTLTVTFQYFL